MPAKPRVLSIPAAGKLYFGLTRGPSYEAAKRGTIPTIRLGPRRFVVPVEQLEKLLRGEGK